MVCACLLSFKNNKHAHTKPILMAGIHRKLQSWLAPGQERAQFLTHRPRNLPHISKIQKNVFTFMALGVLVIPMLRLMVETPSLQRGHSVPPKGSNKLYQSRRPSKGIPLEGRWPVNSLKPPLKGRCHQLDRRHKCTRVRVFTLGVRGATSNASRIFEQFWWHIRLADL